MRPLVWLTLAIILAVAGCNSKEAIPPTDTIVAPGTEAGGPIGFGGSAEKPEK